MKERYIQMCSDKIKNVVEVCHKELWGNRDLSVFDKYCDPNLTIRSLTDRNIILNIDGIKAGLTEWFSCFPDIKLIHKNIRVDTNNTVVIEWEATVTHTNEFRGFKATNKTISKIGTSFFKVHNNKIIEWDDKYDINAFIAELSGTQ